MFVVDLLSASILATAFSIFFYRVVRSGKYPASLPRRVLPFVMVSWIGGIVLIVCGAMIAHWLPFVLATLVLALSLYPWALRGTLRESVRNEPEQALKATRPAIVLYFCTTLLLLFCAISFSFYLVYLS